METELTALKNNGTLIILPPDVKHVGNKWVYKVNHKTSSSI